MSNSRIIKTVYVLCYTMAANTQYAERFWYIGAGKGMADSKKYAKQYRTRAEAQAAERLTRGQRPWSVVSMTIIDAS